MNNGGEQRWNATVHETFMIYYMLDELFTKEDTTFHSVGH